MEFLALQEFKFRAWSQQQAERFVAHIPDLLVLDADYHRWSDSSLDVIVTLQVNASIEQLETILNGMKDVEIIKKTIGLSKGFKPFKEN
ncbi:MAG: hypothetical protein K9J17_14270 [Flavobacteriales bacterium]|nr:hypothetical protein [Flavobacteriales bacterium]